jgi:hypothetical protein
MERALEDVGLRNTCGVCTTPTARPRTTAPSRQEGLGRDVIGVEDDDQVAERLRERVVQVAGLRVLARAADVVRTAPARELAHLFTMTVVEHVDREAR